VLTFREANGNTLLEITKDGTFIVNPLIQLDIDSNSSQEYLTLNIKLATSVI